MSGPGSIPSDGRLLLSYYGDDFTGSTDVMEVLELAGIPTILYLRPPGPDDIAADPDVRAVGLAGVSRSLSTAGIDTELPPLLDALGSLDALAFHYKVCSTFDSSPDTGSIGRAIELARARFGDAPVPLIIGSPPLGRYTVFGQHYARADGVVHRLDRHPTLPRHPVTPMTEADLLVHLAAQTDLPAAAITTVDLDGPAAALADRYDALVADGAAIILFDILTEAHLATIGRLLWERPGGLPPVLVGSSAIESALVAHWRSRGWLDAEDARPDAGERDRALLLGGSCSMASLAQLKHVEAAGYDSIRLTLDDAATDAGRRAIAERAALALAAGRGAAVFTTRGPDECGDTSVSITIGEALAEVGAMIIERERPERTVVAGGDTSGRVARRLGIDALRVIAPIAPGSPLCRARSSDPHIDGLEIALKGGQVGGSTYVEQVRRGKA